MKSTSQLSPVYEAFEVAQGCFKVASDSLAKECSRSDSSDSIDSVKGRICWKVTRPLNAP
jgi:hypothetical protein